MANPVGAAIYVNAVENVLEERIEYLEPMVERLKHTFRILLKFMHHDYFFEKQTPC